MTAAETSFEHLVDPADTRFEALLALYRTAIPLRERKPDAEIRGMAASSVNRVLVATADDVVTGFSTLYVGERVALLEYLATDPDVRGRGLGAALFAEARATSGLPLLVEVDTDRVDCPDRALRSRRIRFYRRLGCRRLEPIDYISPLPGEGPAPRLDLLVAGIAGVSVPAAEVADWLREIYSAVYGCGDGDPRLVAMIAALPDPVPLA